jgi:hypothetical protein
MYAQKNCILHCFLAKIALLQQECIFVHNVCQTDRAAKKQLEKDPLLPQMRSFYGIVGFLSSLSLSFSLSLSLYLCATLTVPPAAASARPHALNLRVCVTCHVSKTPGSYFATGQN